MATRTEEGDPSAAPATRPVTRRPLRIAAMTAYAVALTVWSLLIGIPNDTVGVFLWLWVGTIAWNAGAGWRYQLRFPRDWWPILLGLILYFYSRGLTDEVLGLPVHYSMPIDVDRWLGGGQIPTERLQHALCGDPCLRSSDPRWYDVVFTTTYTTHFVTGLTIAAVLWVRDRALWVPWIRRYLVINYAALVVYVVYPMAPPWLAAEKGYLDPDVIRITGRGWADLGLGRFDIVLQGVGNPVAAMPSLHAGMSCLIAIYAIARLRTPWRWLLVVYPVLMSTALVYYGEHYVVDVLAGLVLAIVVALGCSAWERRRDARAGRDARDSRGADSPATVVRSS